MTKKITTILAVLLFVVPFFIIAKASASEVTGTLSSSGVSSQTTRQSTNGTLSGTVTGTQSRGTTGGGGGGGTTTTTTGGNTIPSSGSQVTGSLAQTGPGPNNFGVGGNTIEPAGSVLGAETGPNTDTSGQTDQLAFGTNPNDGSSVAESGNLPANAAGAMSIGAKSAWILFGILVLILTYAAYRRYALRRGR